MEFIYEWWTLNFNIQLQLGIILKKLPYGEADEIITLLLKDEGIRRFFVAGSRKSKKRYLGLIDQFAHLKFHYKPSLKGLWRIHDVEEIAFQEQPWRELNHFAFGSFLAELIYEYTPEAVVDHHLYELWIEMIQALPNNNYPLPTYSHYLYKFFQITGYALVLNQCVNCGEANLPDPVLFDHLRGGVVCENCDPLRGQLSQSKMALNIFQMIQTGQPNGKDIQQDNWLPLLKELTKFSQNILQKQSRAASFFLQSIENL